MTQDNSKKENLLWDQPKNGESIDEFKERVKKTLMDKDWVNADGGVDKEALDS